MDETSGKQEGEIKPEARKETWEWEVIEDPTDRLRLIDTTINERVQQKLTVAVGFAELAGSENPNFDPSRKKNAANQAKQYALLASKQLLAIQTVIRLDPKQPLPIDRTTYANIQKAIIVLDQVPDLPK